MGAGAAAPTGVGSSPAPIGGSFAGGYPAVVPPASTPIATPTATPSSTPQGGKGGNPTSNALPEGKPFRPPLNESGFGDPRGFNNGATPALNTQASSAGAAALGQPNALTAPQQPYVNPYVHTYGQSNTPQQPYVNPYIHTYGQNNTPQQQMFNRFPQRFQQPQPVAQPAQGPVYADQSLNAPGNQPQQYGGQPQQPQYGRFGRGFMPQNRGGYDRQMDQLRGQGQYGQQQGAQQAAFMNNLLSGQQQSPANAEAEYRARLPQIQPAYNSTPQQVQQLIKQQNDAYNSYRPQQPGGMQQAASSAAPADAEAAWNRTTQQAHFAPGTDMVKAKQDFMRRYNPPGGMRQAAFMTSYPTAGQTPIPDYARPYVQQQGAQQVAFMNNLLSGQQPVAVQPSAPAGGKGGNPTAQLPPPPNQDGTPGSWSTYI